MEDLPRPCSQVAGADGYAKKHDPFLYWDEGSSSDGCCTDAHGGRIATIVAGHDVRRHARSSRPVDHSGVLRTIENALGLVPLGGAARQRSGTLATLFAPPDVR